MLTPSNSIRQQTVLDAALRNSECLISNGNKCQTCCEKGDCNNTKSINSISEMFGCNVFGLKDISKALPKSTFQSFVKQMKGRQSIDKQTADQVSHAVRVWASGKGATHFTHWFQPITDSTAEKHDSFLCLKSMKNDSMFGIEQNIPLEGLSGQQLLQSEPDASSFPSGGMRSTFEARGYTIWDTTSPMFIRKSQFDSTKCVLYIPSIYISYNGEALDQKTLLLRSSEGISKAACELLSLIDPVPKGAPNYVNKVHNTLGTEQEFFLIDQGLHRLRTDLVITGRTLIGSLPPKHQQLEDHYFGSMPPRVLKTIQECEQELCKLGVPIKTRHNEVAPSQFEMAPIFEDSVIAVDHNLLTMDVLHQTAQKNKLQVLYHEKPFDTINGSGKHCNWSLSTDMGKNLLDPTCKPESNYEFLLFLLAVLDAVHQNSGLLRATIASASNDHRLGANEAPPGIISVFLGSHLTEVLNSIEESREVKSFSIPELKTIKVGGTKLDVKISALPNIDRDLTDRNRTSPFAFTGNKFEFRAVGSKQSPSFPVAMLNSAVALSLKEISQKLRDKKGNKEFVTDEDKLSVIKEYIVKTKNIRFEGDNYSKEWEEEATKNRNLPNIKKSISAFKELIKEENIKRLTNSEYGIFSKSELSARYHILVEKYYKDVLVEANTLLDMINQMVIPSVIEYKTIIANSLNSLKQLNESEIDISSEKNILKSVSSNLKNLVDFQAKLKEKIIHCNSLNDDQIDQKADVCCYDLLPIMGEVRKYSDLLEMEISDKQWQLPKYRELLFY